MQNTKYLIDLIKKHKQICSKLYFIIFVKIFSMNIKIVNTSKHQLPAYETEYSAGMDLRAELKEVITLKPMERSLIPTGLFIELPLGYEAQIRPRSGLAYKHGITVLNSPGTIDADYRGEIKVILVNLSNNEYVINDGERIAQMIISQHAKISWTAVELLEQTSRGEGGFGHTGK
jgi:dUTP pyrophosphatase